MFKQPHFIFMTAALIAGAVQFAPSPARAAGWAGVDPMHWDVLDSVAKHLVAGEVVNAPNALHFRMDSGDVMSAFIDASQNFDRFSVVFADTIRTLSKGLVKVETISCDGSGLMAGISYCISVTYSAPSPRVGVGRLVVAQNGLNPFVR